MVYITINQVPQYRQMSLEELLFSTAPARVLITANNSNTKTYQFQYIPYRYLEKFNISTNRLIEKLKRFNEQTEELRAKERSELYKTFYIPKQNGKPRRIDAPTPPLMDALRVLKTIFEEDFYASYHTSAFAYIKNRSTVSALKRHQANESRWFAKLDLSNFFGSTTLDFVMQQFSMIFPFNEVVSREEGREALQTALELAFYNGGLPQGTPISPLITNVMMIPIDYRLSKTLREFENQRFIYTRYADDFTISSRYDFKVDKIEKLIVDTLESFSAPFRLNAEKTRYGSSSGHNVNLGLVLNKDNEITVGHKKKRQLQTMLVSYVQSKASGEPWDISDIHTIYGLYNYYHMVEPRTMENIIEYLNEKQGVDIIKMIKADLAA